MNEREQLAKYNGMTIEFVNWFFDNKKEGCGNSWFIMMAAMWEGWSGREAKCAALAAENAALNQFCKDAEFDADYEAELGMERGGFTDALNDIKTQSTDAFLAEVRASAVDGAIAELNQLAERSEKEAPIAAEHHRSAALYLHLFAAQLRREASK